MSDNNSLDELRKDIDKINNQLVELLNKRAKVAQKIGAAKTGKRIYQPAREAAVLQQITDANKGPLPKASMLSIFKEIIAACRNLEQQLKVAYLGPAGTYSEEAARKHLGNTCDFRPYPTFDETIRAAEKGETDVAVVAVENSTEGGVNHTQDLLLQTPLKACGEIMLPIHHQLLGNAKFLDHITAVAAHPQALAQCRLWLDAHLPKAERRTVSSNAEAVVMATEQPRLAAIASARAAEMYNLPALAANIEDDTNNTTRFIVLGRDSTQPSGADKVSLICSVPNKPGSLGKLLAILTGAGINMSRLESRPSPSGLWEYVFYIDIDGHEQDDKIAASLDKMRDMATFVKVLGSYPKAKP